MATQKQRLDDLILEGYRVIDRLNQIRNSAHAGSLNKEISVALAAGEIFADVVNDLEQKYEDLKSKAVINWLDEVARRGL